MPYTNIDYVIKK